MAGAEGPVGYWASTQSTQTQEFRQESGTRNQIQVSGQPDPSSWFLSHARNFEGLQVSPRLTQAAGLHHVADAVQVTEARAARDVDDAAPLVTAEGRLAATWAGNLDAARA